MKINDTIFQTKAQLENFEQSRMQIIQLTEEEISE